MEDDYFDNYEELLWVHAWGKWHNKLAREKLLAKKSFANRLIEEIRREEDC